MIRKLTEFEPARYLVASVGPTLANNVVLIGGDRIGLGYGPLIAASWVIGGSLGYLLHSRYTFKAASNCSAYLRFMGAVALGVPLGFVVLAGLKSGLGLPMWIAAPGATLGMLAYNFLSAKLAILWRRYFFKSNI